ncbi:MAG: thioredoxin-disulfide reductase [Christensenellaceae bacterium]|jgi:thioredoxin reductase (NADPH)
MYDILIIGGGPAGLSAAIYSARAGMSTLVIEKEVAGGQIIFTKDLENYPGLASGVTGADFSVIIKEQAERFGAKIVSDEVVSFDAVPQKKRVICKSGEEYEAGAVVLALGASPKKLGIPGEKEFTGMGVSYCATCDGAFFKGMEVAIVGGGDTALEDAIYLSSVVEKVYVIHRRNEFRANEYYVRRAEQIENIEFVMNVTTLSIDGGLDLEGIRLRDNETGEESLLEVAGVFVAVGREPDTALVKGLLPMDESGYLIVGENTKTRVPGLFAAGDVRVKTLRQVVTAAADGAVAATSAIEYLLIKEMAGK